MKYITITPSSTGQMLGIFLLNNYPMVYTLETVRRSLNEIDGASAEWEGEDGRRPDLALELAVAGIQEYQVKYNFISSHLGVGKKIYSRLDPLTRTYRVIISDPMDDYLLGVPIPLANGEGNHRFELMFTVGMRQSAGNVSDDA
jgi:hypothetical protein